MLLTEDNSICRKGKLLRCALKVTAMEAFTSTVGLVVGGAIVVVVVVVAAAVVVVVVVVVIVQVAVDGFF